MFSFNKNENLFGSLDNSQTNSLFESTTTSLFGDSQKKSKPYRNNERSLFGSFPTKKFLGCNHDDKYCAFYLGQKNSCICYKCIYEYNIDKEECIPFDKNYNYYIDLCKDYLNEMGGKIKNIVNETLNQIDKLKLELDKINNIESVLDKIDLNFRLPIEVSFEERLKIGIIFLGHLVKEFNLFNNELENLKTITLNSYKDEIIKLQSKVEFTLKGLIIPKISKEFKDKIIFSYKKMIDINIFGIINQKKELEEKEVKKDIKVYFEDNEEKKLTLVRFVNNILIDQNMLHEITISGIKNCNYIDNSEYFNYHHNTTIRSNNEHTILAGFIIV